VTSVSDILGRKIGYTEALPAMIKGFSTALDLDLTQASPSAAETARAQELAETKFSAREWIYRR